MQKIKRHILTWFLVFALILTSVSVAFASDDVDLNLYRNRLEEINAELGTSYKIPDKEEIKVTGMTYEELQQFYGEMSLEEFDQYIYQLDSENDRTKVIDVSVGSQISNPGIAPAATDSTQYYYYSSSNSNYLAVFTKIVQSGGITYYNSVTGYGRISLL